tara:strand:+ start:137 stop:646 length:510 start_codon:yes stop_codon:yes gene_type:complete
MDRKTIFKTVLGVAFVWSMVYISRWKQRRLTHAVEEKVLLLQQQIQQLQSERRAPVETPNINNTACCCDISNAVRIDKQVIALIKKCGGLNTLQADEYGQLLKKWRCLKRIRNHLVHNPTNTTLKTNKRNEQIALAKSMMTELQRIIVDRKSDANCGYTLSPGRLFYMY